MSEIKSGNYVKEVVKDLLLQGYNEREIIEFIIEVVVEGMVECVPENDRLDYLLNNIHIIKDFRKYVNINNILSKIIVSDKAYNGEMLDYVIRLKLSLNK